MFRVFLTVLAALALFARAAAGQTAAEASVLSPEGDSADVVMEVDGLTCPFCSFGLEKKLLALEAVDKIDIKLSEGLVHIFLKPGKQLSDDALRKAVKDAGFGAGEIKRREPGPQSMIETRGLTRQ